MSKLSQWKNRGKSQGIPKLDSRRDKKVSAGQARLFFLQQMHGDSLFYQYGHLYTFPSVINPKEIEERLTKIIEEQSILRSNYKLLDGNIIATLQEDIKFNFQEDDGSLEDFFTKPFALESDLLIRAKIFGGNQLAISIHHIVADRESLIIIQNGLFGINDKYESEIDFFDFANWYNDKIDKKEDLLYWKQKLSDAPSLLNLPFDYTRKSNPTYAGKTIEKQVSEKLFTRVKEACKEHRVTVYVFMLAAYKVLLSKYTGQEDILIGTPVSNRDRKELEAMVGFFNETLILKSKLAKDKPFSSFLQDVKAEFLEVLARKNVSYSSIVKTVNPERIAGVNPIFQSMFLYNRTENSLSYHGSPVGDEVKDLGISKFDLTLFVHEEAKKLNLRLEYSTELFTDTTAERIFTDYIYVLELLMDDIEVELGDIELYTEASESIEEQEDDQVTDKNSVLDLIPVDLESSAVRFQEESISYSELNAKSKQLACVLRKRGVQKNDIIGLYAERSIEMIIGILAIMKAGGAYLPLDPKYPKERLEYMIKDSACKVILSHGKHLIKNKTLIDINGQHEEVEDVTLPVIDSKQLAYIIYTSGSSGKPKGVQINHSNLVFSTSSRFKFYKEEVGVFMLLSSFSFDSSVAGIFWTLCSGGVLLLPPEKIEQDIDRFTRIIEDYRVTHTLMLPSLYEVLLDFSAPERLSSLTNVMVAGEACSPKIVEKHFEKQLSATLYNEYGPTEATVWCIAHKMRAGQDEVPIGKEIPYYKVFILDKNHSRVPTNVIGELYIGGPGLSPGYLDRPELTEEKFIHHESFGRIYKTGDLAKSNEKGEILFLGRADSQVKIRGHRVELDEIKKRIFEKSAANEVEVVYKNKRLIAYTNKAIDSDLELPEYMTPTQFVVLDEFPKLPNGKTNIHGLPSPEELERPNDFVPASTEIEVILSEIWKELLQIDSLSIDDNFFALGGDSLISIKMLAQAKAKGLDISATTLFEYQTIRELSAFIEGPKDESKNQIVVPLKKNGNERPLFCIHGGGAHVFFYKVFAEKLGADIPVYSFQPEGLDGTTQMPTSIEEMSSTYIAEMQKIQERGPYNILGTCFSNAVALEMANQLTKKGEEVDNLFIIDSAPVHLFGNKENAEKQTFRRFLDMLKRGDYTRISSKISRRIFGAQSWNSPIKDAVESDEVLKETIFSLNKMYADYDWEPFRGKIRFIRSSEFNSRNDKKYHLTQWKKLAKKGLDIRVVPGHHLTLFEEPEVDDLATEVTRILAES